MFDPPVEGSSVLLSFIDSQIEFISWSMKVGTGTTPFNCTHRRKNKRMTDPFQHRSDMLKEANALAYLLDCPGQLNYRKTRAFSPFQSRADVVIGCASHGIVHNNVLAPWSASHEAGIYLRLR